MTEQVVSNQPVHRWYTRPVFFVADVNRAARFYVDLLGFEKGWHEADGAGRVCQVNHGECEIFVASSPRGQFPRRRPGGVMTRSKSSIQTGMSCSSRRPIEYGLDERTPLLRHYANIHRRESFRLRRDGDVVQSAGVAFLSGSRARPDDLLERIVRDTVVSRGRTHPVRGKGRAHLSRAATTTSIFFRPVLQTRA